MKDMLLTTSFAQAIPIPVTLRLFSPTQLPEGPGAFS